MQKYGFYFSYTLAPHVLVTRWLNMVADLSLSNRLFKIYKFAHLYLLPVLQDLSPTEKNQI